MFRLNGIGTSFNGFNYKAETDSYKVTLWFSFLFFPIFPISAKLIKREITRSNEFKLVVLENLKLDGKQILTTYFYGWVIGPLLWFWPIPFAVIEVAEKIGYAESNFYNVVIAFTIIWLIVFAWKWKDWEEERGLPKNYKQILKSKNVNEK